MKVTKNLIFLANYFLEEEELLKPMRKKTGHKLSAKYKKISLFDLKHNKNKTELVNSNRGRFNHKCAASVMAGNSMLK